MTNLEQENKEIGLRIRAARKAKRLNQTEFAELLNKSLRTVQKYESGEIEVSVAVIKEIAKVLECSPSYLLGWDEENKVLASFSDVVRFVFELNRTNELKFNIDIKKSDTSFWSKSNLMCPLFFIQIRENLAIKKQQ